MELKPVRLELVAHTLLAVKYADEEQEEKATWRENAEWWVGFFDTPDGTEEWERLLDGIALEQGFDIEAELKDSESD